MPTYAETEDPAGSAGGGVRHLPILDPSPHVDPPVWTEPDAAGVGGCLKAEPEDFRVDEVPAYEPSGEGEHLVLLIEKRDMSTLELVAALSRHFGVPKRAVGYAGLKDKRAITRQQLSVHLPGVDDPPPFTHDRAEVLASARHGNKIRRGHLRGNRFVIRIRETNIAGVLRARRVLDTLARVGVPNRFGGQRFGLLGNNHLIGRAMVLGDAPAALDLLLGPNPAAPENQADFRRLYAEGDYRGTLLALPRGLHAEQSALRQLTRGAKPSRAIASLDSSEMSYYISSLQSAVFNAVLDRRLLAAALGRLFEGDVAFKHASRGVFTVTADMLGSELDDRLASFEISPSGPMWGTKLPMAAGDVLDAEVSAIEALGLRPDDITHCPSRYRKMVHGARRPLRVPLLHPSVEAGADDRGQYIQCAFELPRGSFATVVLREVMKPEA